MMPRFTLDTETQLGTANRSVPLGPTKCSIVSPGSLCVGLSLRVADDVGTRSTVLVGTRITVLVGMAEACALHHDEDLLPVTAGI